MIDPHPIKKTDIVFLGDSLTEGFDLVNHFKRNDLRNRGISGNLTDHILYRLEEIINAKPTAIFLMIGINDLFYGKKAEEVFENIRYILELIYNNTPESMRYLQSVLPINESRLLMDEGLNTSIYKLNGTLAEYCLDKPKLKFLEIHSEFLNMNGRMKGQYTFDGVHLSPEGYTLWAELISEYLS
ncbi:MAG: GDSL-type esterase/lipase family protein [Bacteroidales bacterium]